MNSHIDSDLATDSDSQNQDSKMSIKDQLLDMIRNSPDLPTLGDSISNIVQISSSVDEPIRNLANLILADVSLTQKVIRLANSVSYRTSSGQVVTSITRAIQVLGLETIKACALAMILVDGMPKSHAKHVRRELAIALSASFTGRKLAKRSSFPNAEEIAIVALFKNMGRLLVAAFDEKLYEKIMNLVQNDGLTKEQASQQIIGCSFDTLTKFALEEWNIPKSIIDALQLIPAKTLAAPKNRQEWMQQAAEFSELTASLVIEGDTSTDNNLEKTLLNRFGQALQLNKTNFNKLLTEVKSEAKELINQIESSLSQKKNNRNTSAEPEMTDDELDDLICEPIDSNTSQSTQYYPSGKPQDAFDRLMTSMHQLSEITASSDCKLSDVIAHVLKTLYDCLGFEFVTVCFKDVKTNQYRARNSIGNGCEITEQHFVFPDTTSNDLFQLAINKNVDLSIANASDPKMHAMLPNWHKRLLPDTKSFIIMPLIIKKNPIGFFYADRPLEAPEGISTDEMKLIKTLKGLVLTYLRS